MSANDRELPLAKVGQRQTPINTSPALLNIRRGFVLYSSLIRISKIQQNDLIRLVSTAMPFGKHKGTLIADLPGNYLNWFARQGFPPGDIGRLLALMQEIDHNGLSHLLKPLRQQSYKP